MSTFVVSTVPADGLAPSGARLSAGTVMSKPGSQIYMELALKELTDYRLNSGKPLWLAS